MTFTIGMATYEDFPGVWATVQSALIHNEWKELPEIVIVDTSPPGSEHRRLVQNLASKHKNIVYVSAPHLIGTTSSREAIFANATGEYIVVMDCHVICPHNVLSRLHQWFKENPTCTDLIHGPMLYDDLHTMATHMVDQFRGSMRGTWSHGIYHDPCLNIYFCIEEEEVTDENRKRKPNRQYLDVLTSQPLPNEALFLGMEMGCTDSDTPIPIHGHGMGLFATRRDSWLGFAEGCSGFGGEELNIHDKYRQHGRNAVCLPFLKWNHRFGRAGGAPYPLRLVDKVRNYIIWAKELDALSRMKSAGRNDRSDELMRRTHTHFVKGGILPQRTWDKLVMGPSPPSRPSPPQKKPVDELFRSVAPRFPYAEEIRNLVQRVESVTAFVSDSQWQPILAAGFPTTLTVYTTKNKLTNKTHEAVEVQRCKDSRRIDKFDTLFTLIPEEEPAPAELVIVDSPELAKQYKHLATKYLLIYSKELPVPINLQVI